eukprot:403938-Rhodomonas_salina.1
MVECTERGRCDGGGDWRTGEPGGGSERIMTRHPATDRQTGYRPRPLSLSEPACSSLLTLHKVAASSPDSNA